MPVSTIRVITIPNIFFLSRDRFLSSFAGKHFVKKQNALNEPAYPPAGTQLLRVTREVLAIHTSGLTPGSFEVPSDFEKAE